MVVHVSTLPLNRCLLCLCDPNARDDRDDRDGHGDHDDDQALGTIH